MGLVSPSDDKVEDGDGVLSLGKLGQITHIAPPLSVPFATWFGRASTLSLSLPL